MENPYYLMDDLGGNTPIFGNIHVEIFWYGKYIDVNMRYDLWKITP